jgi:hypothetical protein
VDVHPRLFDLLLRLLELLPPRLVLVLQDLQLLDDLAQVDEGEAAPLQLAVEELVE